MDRHARCRRAARLRSPACVSRPPRHNWRSAEQGGVPQDATAVWLNLTVADPTLPTVLAAYPGPCGAPPLSSNVNARAKHSTASSVLVGIGGDGSVCVLTFTGSSHIVVDVAGWFGPGPAACRIARRRRNGCSILDWATVSGRVPETAVHVDGVSVLNVVAVDSVAPGFVAVRPCGSDLDQLIGQHRAGGRTRPTSPLSAATLPAMCACDRTSSRTSSSTRSQRFAP